MSGLRTDGFSQLLGSRRGAEDPARKDWTDRLLTLTQDAPVRGLLALREYAPLIAHEPALQRAREHIVVATVDAYDRRIDPRLRWALHCLGIQEDLAGRVLAVPLRTAGDADVLLHLTTFRIGRRTVERASTLCGLRFVLDATSTGPGPVRARRGAWRTFRHGTHGALPCTGCAAAAEDQVHDDRDDELDNEMSMGTDRPLLDAHGQLPAVTVRAAGTDAVRDAIGELIGAPENVARSLAAGHVGHAVLTLQDLGSALLPALGRRVVAGVGVNHGADRARDLGETVLDRVLGAVECRQLQDALRAAHGPSLLSVVTSAASTWERTIESAMVDLDDQGPATLRSDWRALAETALKMATVSQEVGTHLTGDTGECR